MSVDSRSRGEAPTKRPETTVATITVPAPVTITPRTTWAQLHELRTQMRAGVPVVDPQGTLLGVVSDVERFDRAGPRATAHDLMTEQAVTVVPELPVADAAGLLHGDAHQLFVVREGKLVGVVRRGDILAVSAGDIRMRIEDEVLGMLPDLDPRCLRVTVDQGQVQLTGRVPWHRDVAACSRVASATPGVTMVVNRLDYVWDDRPRRRWPVRHHS